MLYCRTVNFSAPNFLGAILVNIVGLSTFLIWCAILMIIAGRSTCRAPIFWETFQRLRADNQLSGYFLWMFSFLGLIFGNDSSDNCGAERSTFVEYNLGARC